VSGQEWERAEPVPPIKIVNSRCLATTTRRGKGSDTLETVVDVIHGHDGSW
jgi:hypothetical protein